MPPPLRKAALTAHVVASVGWLGAVVVVLALAVLGSGSQDRQVVAGAHMAMDAVARAVLVPASLATLLTGLIQSLGTRWGLWRHYWVIIKLLITVVATAVLLLYISTLQHLAAVAAQPTWSAADLALLGSPSVIVHASGALVLLAGATVLAIYKPAGVTRYGWRRQQAGGGR